MSQFENYETRRAYQEFAVDYINHRIEDLSVDELRDLYEKGAMDLGEQIERAVYQEIDRCIKNDDGRGINLAKSWTGAFVQQVDWYSIGETFETAISDAIDFRTSKE